MESALARFFLSGSPLHMRRTPLLPVLILALALGFGRAEATIVVNTAMPIDREVVVQLIQAREDNGSGGATVLGNDTQRLAIELALDQIWAQAGIDITLLPAFTPYDSSFALDADGAGGTRSTNDLTTIFVQAAANGVLNTNNVIHTIFVDHVPGFTVIGESSAAGLASISDNKIAMFTGDNLLGSQEGLDIIAKVFAHEIGHNFGLNHTANNLPNLMAPGGTTEQLNASQITIARSSSLLRAVPEPGAAFLVSLGFVLFAARRSR